MWFGADQVAGFTAASIASTPVRRVGWITGAKSGAPRLSPLAYLTIDGKVVIVGSYAGAPKDPAWVHNLRAHPRIDVEKPGDAGVETVSVAVTEIGDDEWAQTWDRFTTASSGFKEYEKTAEGRRFPIFRLTP